MWPSSLHAPPGSTSGKHTRNKSALLLLLRQSNKTKLPLIYNNKLTQWKSNGREQLFQRDFLPLPLQEGLDLLPPVVQGDADAPKGVNLEAVPEATDLGNEFDPPLHRKILHEVLQSDVQVSRVHGLHWRRSRSRAPAWGRLGVVLAALVLRRVVRSQVLPGNGSVHHHQARVELQPDLLLRLQLGREEPLPALVPTRHVRKVG
mmetsp:Transcript_8641/g.20450  ORF Transcript_8641/g.20450 Transcript_8641/m.20450 type:complete len:204 (-) Transcript_8641:269-880(-)